MQKICFRGDVWANVTASKPSVFLRVVVGVVFSSSFELLTLFCFPMIDLCVAWRISYSVEFHAKLGGLPWRP